MSVRSVKFKEQTKDGRKWLFEVRYKDLLGHIKSQIKEIFNQKISPRSRKNIYD
jgi:hypothetical protein